MTIIEMEKGYASEIKFLQEITEYEYGLVPFESEEEAAETIRMWVKDFDEVPKTFTGICGAQIMMTLWNTFITPSQEIARQANIEHYDERMKEEHPDWLHFDGYYENGSCLFIDPDDISDMLARNHYDEAHRELIAKALMAYYKTYRQNL